MSEPGAATERRLIEIIRRAAGRAPTVRVGIGDDCAVLEPAAGSLLLATTDLLIEDVHFRRRWATPMDIGWKSLAVNLSDIAAMGGRPRWGLIALACPEAVTVDDAEAFWRVLPTDDPIASQVAICDALAEINGARATEINRLHALFALERRSLSLLEGLLSEYVSPSSPSPDRERKVRQAVLELSRSFASAYELFLRQVRGNNAGGEWKAYAAAILVQLFKHREIDLLVALYRYEAWPRGRWSELHGAYEFALTSDLARRPVGADRRNGRRSRRSRSSRRSSASCCCN